MKGEVRREEREEETQQEELSFSSLKFLQKAKGKFFPTVFEAPLLTTCQDTLKREFKSTPKIAVAKICDMIKYGFKYFEVNLP